MFKWIRSLFRGRPAGERVLDLEREVQGLRLELEERDGLIAALKEDLGRERGGAGDRVARSVEARVEELLAGAATPVAQLTTQAHLLAGGQPVQAKDVLAVARRLVRALEDGGLELVGEVGETASFDRDRHEPLSAAAPPSPGERVVVRFVGVAYRGRLLSKAGVERG